MADEYSRTSWQDHTRAVFDSAANDAPALLEGAKLVALGSHGIVADHQDGTVSKLFLHKDDAAGQAYAEKLYNEEINILKLLGGMAFGEAETPALLGETAVPGGKTVFASYRMTKMPGQEIKWDNFLKTASDAEIERHFRSAGNVLARFHADAPQLAALTPPVKGISGGAGVDAIPGIDDMTARALAACDAYLRAHMQGGVNHGDFHPANFKVNDKFEITGLFDCSYAGKTQNYLTDFAALPDRGLPFAIDAYERAGGRPVDPTMLALTQISMDVAAINWLTAHPQRGPAALAEKMDDLHRHLDKVKHVTGIDAAPAPAFAPAKTRAAQL